MNLHDDEDAFLFAVDGANKENPRLRPGFLEKDYWVTIALKRLFESEYSRTVVFKGGTSLSKCHQVVDRFSEDVDLAINNPWVMETSDIQKLLVDIEAAISVDLDVNGKRTESKALRRTTVHNFRNIVQDAGDAPMARGLKLELTAFSHAHPYCTMPVESYLGHWLRRHGHTDLIEEFGMQPFQIQVLELERTFAEKVMALVRHSRAEKPIQSLRDKVRHMYDLQQMISKRPEISRYLQSEQFFEFLDRVSDDDRIGTSAPHWVGCEYGTCCLFQDTAATWSEIRDEYHGTFSNMVFGDLPHESEILEALSMIGDRLDVYDRDWRVANEDIPSPQNRSFPKL